MLRIHRLRQAQNDARHFWKSTSRYDKIIFSAVILYVTLVSAYLVWHHNLVSPDQFFIVALLIAVLLGRGLTFLWDWLPLIVLLFGYEYVRGLVPLLNDHVHFQPMIWFDRSVFGIAPTVALQARFFNAGSPHWYDYAAVSLYLLHFVIPLAVGFLFWLRDRSIFREYSAAILILSYLAYLTYLVFPAAPPWLAAQAGLMPNVNKILDVTFASFRDPVYLPTVYYKLGVNMVAAVPSLHAAYPLLVALFVGEKAPKLVPLLGLYVFSVWIAIVYLGEHYVFDVLCGAVYAVAVYAFVISWPAIRARLTRRKEAPAEVPTAV